jgi:hypothetical protein
VPRAEHLAPYVEDHGGCVPFAELCRNQILNGARIAGSAAPHQQMRHTPRPLKSLRSLRTGYETCFVAFERSKCFISHTELWDRSRVAIGYFGDGPTCNVSL